MHLENRDLKRVGEKKIYLMTDAGSEYSDDQLEQICAGLKAQNVDLIVMYVQRVPQNGDCVAMVTLLLQRTEY